MPEGTLEVILIGAQNLKDTELLGKSDPYAVITCGAQQKRSTTADDQGSHPTWNQRFNFNVDNNTASIGVRIFNENVFKDDEIGFAMIPLAKAFSEGRTVATAYPVVRPSGRPQGEVKVVLNFVPKGRPIAANVSADGTKKGTGYPPGQHEVYPPPGHSENAPYLPAGDSSAHYPSHQSAYPPPAANYYGMTPSVQTPPGPQPAYPPPAAVIPEMHGGPEKGVKEKEKYSSAAAYGSQYPPAGYLEKPEKHGGSEKGEKHKDKDKEKEKHKEKGEKEKHQASPYPAYGGFEPAVPGHYAPAAPGHTTSYPPPPPAYPPPAAVIPELHGGPEKKEKEKYSSAAAYGSPYPPAGYLEKPEKHGGSEKGEKHKDKDKEKEKHKEKEEKEKHHASPHPAYGGFQPAAPGHYAPAAPGHYAPAYAYPPPNPQYGHPPAGSHNPQHDSHGYPSAPSHNPQHGGHGYPSAPSHGMVDKHGKYKEGKHKKEGKYKHKHKGGFKFNWSFDDE